MSVSFTPGDHPTSASRTASTISVSRLQTASRDEDTQSVTGTPITSSPLTTNFPFRDPINRDVEDPERQPLIETAEVNRARTFWPVFISIVVVIAVGLLIGFGGWNLGKGAGGGRWPGGPGYRLVGSG